MDRRVGARQFLLRTQALGRSAGRIISRRIQAIGAVSIFLWTFITAGATLLVIKAIMGLRPTMEDEMEGMDASEVGVSAYPEFSE